MSQIDEDLHEHIDVLETRFLAAKARIAKLEKERNEAYRALDDIDFMRVDAYMNGPIITGIKSREALAWVMKWKPLIYKARAFAEGERKEAWEG